MLEAIHPITHANYFELLAYVITVLSREKIANYNLCINAQSNAGFSSVYDYTEEFAFALTSFTRPTAKCSRDLVVVIFTLYRTLLLTFYIFTTVLLQMSFVIIKIMFNKVSNIYRVLKKKPFDNYMVDRI